MDEIPVAVILAASEEDLLTILSISDLLYDVRFILILPDREDITVAIGHSSGRFMSYADSDFREVTAVLGKMIGGFYLRRRTRELRGKSDLLCLKNRGACRAIQEAGSMSLEAFGHRGKSGMKARA